MSTNPKVLVPLAEGFEEIETVCIIDLLRRVEAEVVVASIMGKDKNLTILGRSGIKMEADAYFEDIQNDEYDLIACSGGIKNADSMGAHKALVAKIKNQRDQGKWFSAICAAPKKVLDDNGLLEGYNATSHPALPLTDYKFGEQRVVVDRNLITSRGPGNFFAKSKHT